MEAAVIVKDAFKSFSSLPVLKGFSMTVHKGIIYSLLGPSGCGKTTLLSCILDLEPLSSGTIQLSVNRHKDIGYMPQEISLHQELTLKEILQYYGLIYGLDLATIKEKSSRYMHIFEIPNSNRLLSTFSGGQQRRVSLMVSLFHDPQLIILDEPTVGLDPIVQEKAWDCLAQLSNDEGKTIIITTHYIEEARRTNKVGLMRDGVLIEEEQPQVLMDKMNCTTMEETFLKLCHSQNEPEAPPDRNEKTIFKFIESFQQSRAKHPPNIKQDTKFSWNRFYSQLHLNFVKVKRTIWVLMFTLIVPSLQGFLWGVNYSNPSLDLDMGIYSEEIQDACTGHAKESLPRPFTCSFWESIHNNFRIVQYHEENTGMRDLRQGRISCLAVIGKNFTPASINRFSLGQYTSDQDYDMSTISVYIAYPEYPIRVFIEHVLGLAYRNSIKVITASTDLSPRLTEPPMKTEFLIQKGLAAFNTEAAAFLNGFVFYFGMMVTATMLLEEERSGVLARASVTGLTYLEMIAAHVSMQSVVLLIQSAIMFYVMYHLFGLIINGSITLGLFILFLQGLVGCFLGILCVQIMKNALVLSYFIVGMLLALLFLTGSLWPVDGLWWGLKLVALVTPSSLGVASFRAVMLRGLGVTHPVVYTGILAALAWLVVISCTTTLVSKIKRLL